MFVEKTLYGNHPAPSVYLSWIIFSFTASRKKDGVFFCHQTKYSTGVKVNEAKIYIHVCYLIITYISVKSKFAQSTKLM